MDGCARPSVRGTGQMDFFAHARFCRVGSRPSFPPRPLNSANGGSGVSGPAVNAMTLFRGTKASLICCLNHLLMLEEAAPASIPEFIRWLSYAPPFALRHKLLAFARNDSRRDARGREGISEIPDHLDGFSCLHNEAGF